MRAALRPFSRDRIVLYRSCFLPGCKRSCKTKSINQKRAFLSGTEDDSPNGGVEGAARLSCKIFGLAWDRWLRIEVRQQSDKKLRSVVLQMENGFVGCAEGVRFLFDRADTRYGGFAGLKSLCTTVGGKRCGLAFLQALCGWRVKRLRRSLRAEGRCQRMDRAVALGSDGGLRRRIPAHPPPLARPAAPSVPLSAG